MKKTLLLLLTSIYVMGGPLYVCYDNKYRSQATGKWVYTGCKRYYDSCHSNNKLHFGKYLSDKSASDALYRCVSSSPRFIDSGKQEMIPRTPRVNTVPKRAPRASNREIPRVIKKEPTTGTGFYINTSQIVTNHHVVKSCNKITLRKDGITSNAIVRFVDTTNDLALIETDMQNSHYLKFRQGKGLRVGESIIAMGYPLGVLLGSKVKLTTGVVSSLTGVLNDTTKIQITAPVQPGSSGGPLLDSRGDVVGVIYAKLKYHIAENVSLAIKANVVKIFLDVHEIEYYLDETPEKKEVVDIAQGVKKGILQVICE